MGAPAQAGRPHDPLLQFAHLCFYCLCLWCQTQEVIAKFNVMELSPYVFF